MKAKLCIPDCYAGMTCAEKAWALVLEAAKRRPDDAENRVVLWRFESLVFRISPGNTYRPDFEVLYADGHKALCEVKQQRRDGKLKHSSRWKTSIKNLKTCAKLWPEYDWYVAMREVDGSWDVRRSDELFKNRSA